MAMYLLRLAGCYRVTIDVGETVEAGREFQNVN